MIMLVPFFVLTFAMHLLLWLAGSRCMAGACRVWDSADIIHFHRMAGYHSLTCQQ